MSKLTPLSNRVHRIAQSGWQWVDAKLHPFPEHLGPVFNRYWEEITESQHWDHKQILQYQSEKLAALIEHAYTNVSYYRRIMDERGLLPKDITKPQDLQKLPVLTKTAIRDNYNDLIAKGSEKEYWIESHTSGSTGKPLTFLLDSDSDLREMAYTLRSWTFGSYKLGDPVIQLRSYVPKPGQSVHYHDQRNNFHYLSAYHMTPEVMRQYVSIIVKSKATVLRGYPSSLYILARFLLEENISLPNIDTAITSSEMLLPHYRETIEKALSCPVLDWYGCNERIVTVSQSPTSNGYHTNSEYGILEVLDENQHPLIEGEGDIVGTSLHNTVMPLIRYKPDDRAQRQTATFATDSTIGLPVEITQITGRSDEILAFGDAMVPPINFYTLFHSIPGVTQFQLVQHNDRELEVNLVTSSEYTDSSRELIRNGLLERVGKSTELKISELDSIARDQKTGKVKCIVNHTKRK